jgi:hypothetical protein
MQRGGLHCKTLPMIKKLFLFFPLSLFAFNEKPWLGNAFEWVFNPSYAYTSYKGISGNLQPGEKKLYDHLWKADLSIRFAPCWEFGLEAEIVRSFQRSFGYRSVGGQVRCKWLDDNLGDPVSFVIGLSGRKVSKESLCDVTSPYHSTFNVELNGAVGQQWEGEENTFRCYSLGSVGVANHGFPWIRLLGRLEWERRQKHQIAVFLESCVGFGKGKQIDWQNFNGGYSSTGHGNIDLGFSYTYIEKIWGSFGFTYKKSIYARHFPEKGHCFILECFFPFSLF